MRIKSYKEKEIRNAILKKVKPIINPGKHGKERRGEERSWW